jgi:hypothetical protein
MTRDSHRTVTECLICAVRMATLADPDKKVSAAAYVSLAIDQCALLGVEKVKERLCPRHAAAHKHASQRYRAFMQAKRS